MNVSSELRRAVGVLLLLTPVSLHASTLFSENFDSSNSGLSLTTAGAFTAINGTNVDIAAPGDGSTHCAAPESGNCLDLGGSFGDAFGQIELTQPLNLAAGSYMLSFDLVGSGRGITTSTTVEFGDYLHTFVLASSDDTSGIVLNQVVTVAGGPTQLEFLNNDTTDANVGALLDNVLIANDQAPEPSSLVLMGTGVLALAAAVYTRSMLHRDS